MPCKVASLSQAPRREIIPVARRAFLVRCWRTEDDAGGGWRFSIQQVGSDIGRRAFARPEDLIAYLIQLLESTEM